MYRQLLLESLAAFREGRHSLGRLIEDIDSVWESLPPSQLREEIRAFWWDLEQIYAVEVLDRGSIELPPDAVAELGNALHGLESAAEKLNPDPPS